MTLPQLPDYFRLTGDEETGVTLECSHSAHNYGWEGYPVVTLGGTPPKDVSVAPDLNAFLADIYKHAQMHAEVEVRHRRKFYIVDYYSAHGRRPAGNGLWHLAPLNGDGVPDLSKAREWTGNITDLMDGKVTSNLLALDRVRYAVLP